MVNAAIIRDAHGVPATFVGSKTGQDDAASRSNRFEPLLRQTARQCWRF